MDVSLSNDTSTKEFFMDVSFSNADIGAGLGTSSFRSSLHKNIVRCFGRMCQMDESGLPIVMPNSKVEDQRQKDRPRVQ